MRDEGIKVVARNRRARHDYHIEDTLEAGLVLRGSEIKSIRAGRVNLRQGYATFRDGELWLHDCHIAPYDPASLQNHDPMRPRKLLLNRRELDRWSSKVQERGYTIVPLQLYLRRGLAKVEIALARGKKKYDKRRAIAERDAEREMRRATRRRS